MRTPLKLTKLYQTHSWSRGNIFLLKNNKPPNLSNNLKWLVYEIWHFGGRRKYYFNELNLWKHLGWIITLRAIMLNLKW